MSIQTILESHEDQLHTAELANLIQAAIECAAACEACADACLEEEQDMTRCIRSDLDTADIAAATAKVVGRAGRSGAPWLDQVRVLQKAAVNCAEECEKHDTEHCAVCAQACRRAEQACQDLLAVAG